jgi:toxin ParE1/3/4
VRRFVLTHVAQADIRDILDFLKTESPAATVRVRSVPREAMRLLAERPGIGHLRTDLADETVRFWPVFSYLVIYRPDIKPIQIVRVLHGKRDVRRLLEE